MAPDDGADAATPAGQPPPYRPGPPTPGGAGQTRQYQDHQPAQQPRRGSHPPTGPDRAPLAGTDGGRPSHSNPGRATTALASPDRPPLAGAEQPVRPPGRKPGRVGR
ncbi:hypothetical protein Sros01_46280 [Streptomyces roseochromogenus]|nr:hypothetical protein Sros01_46280 [Streptomyces roseochromogenus]